MTKIWRAESEVLQLVFEGKTIGDIARIREVTVGTIKKQKYRLRQHFHAQTDTGMCHAALENGVLEPPPRKW